MKELILFPAETIAGSSYQRRPLTQSAITCSKLAIETLEHVVKYVQS